MKDQDFDKPGILIWKTKELNGAKPNINIFQWGNIGIIISVHGECTLSYYWAVYFMYAKLLMRQVDSNEITYFTWGSWLWLYQQYLILSAEPGFEHMVSDYIHKVMVIDL